MNSECELIERIGGYANIIVYGAKVRGTVVASRISLNVPLSKLYVAVSDTRGDVACCCGIPVRDIESYAKLSGSSVVLIAAQRKHQDEMDVKARSLGFANILIISESLFSDMFFRYKIMCEIEQLQKGKRRSEFLQYQAMHLLRLNYLQEKVRRGERIRVIFIVTSAAKFHFGSVYRAMEKRPLFDVMVFVFDEDFRDNWVNNADLTSMRLFANTLGHEGYHVVWGYDENDRAVDIEEYMPDIIFYNSPYLLNLAEPHNLQRTVLNHLSYLVPYGMHVANEAAYHFYSKGITPAWRHFIDTRRAYALCAGNAVTTGMNAVLSGWPMLDDYILPLDEMMVQYKKPLVVYAPHWSIATWHNTSAFHIHYKLFPELMKRHPEVSFIFKPHPRLGIEIRMREGHEDAVPLTYEEYIAYCEAWDSSPNGRLVNDSSFIDLFKQADCLITDSYTFITSWLPTGKPCLFLMNPEGPEDPYTYYYDFIRPVIDSYYVCKTVEEIEKAFKDVVLQGNDPKAGVRKRQCDNLIHNLGHAGEFIANYVERQLKP